ncbi:AfsR/SARP family transcriptional regulator [Nocardia pseudovaccinii]|uniref:AfsR/SARP family transcriptional regulator n=1 Tax=Nocardia pseudovaccinii TaxID=189540 RepID=UPI003D8E395F
MRTGAMTPGAETPLDVRILGPVRWYVLGRPLAVGGPLTRAMLAVLVVNRGNATLPPRLANTIWDGDPPPSFRANLHSRIAELRATPQAADVTATAILRTDSSGNYYLDIRDEQCDLGRFEPGPNSLASRCGYRWIRAAGDARPRAVVRRRRQAIRGDRGGYDDRSQCG